MSSRRNLFDRIQRMVAAARNNSKPLHPLERANRLMWLMLCPGYEETKRRIEEILARYGGI